MKLLRYGPAGQEKPGLLDRDGKIRDLSGTVGDIDGAALAPASLDRLRRLDPATLKIKQYQLLKPEQASNVPTMGETGGIIPYGIDIAPDGSYFVVVTTGAFRANRLCDSVNRFELTTIAPNQVPTWTDWTGGDTSWSVSVSGTAVYVGYFGSARADAATIDSMKALQTIEGIE